MIIRPQLKQLDVAGAKKRYKIVSESDPCSCVPDSVWNDKNVIVEEKKDGHRFKFHVFSNVNRLDSRRLSVKDNLYVEKTDNAPILRDLDLSDLDGTIFDGEIVAGKDSNSVAHALGSHATDEEKASIGYVIFDILYFKGVDVRDKKDSVRRALIEKCFAESSLSKHINKISLIERSYLTSQQKKDLLVKTLSADGEGIMLKDTTQPYGSGWSKVKREARYDVIVIGYDDPKQFSTKKGDSGETETKYFKLGWIGAIKFGQYFDGKIKACGQTSGMSDDVRKLVSENKEDYLGRVFEVAAQERFGNGMMRHPRFIRWREDKNAVDCIYKEDEI